jgi:hypothetical protein
MAFYKHDKVNTVGDDPVLGPEWHPTKNPDLDPNTLTTGSGKRVVWLCSQGHEWEARINRRGCCPVCDGRIVTPKNCLASTNPDLAAQWDFSKNVDLSAKDVTEKSIKMVGWICPKDPAHEYEAKIYLRSAGQGCPYCAGKRLLKKDSLAVVYPKVAEEWDYEANKGITPDMVLPYSHLKAGWKCEHNHRWDATIKNRTQHGSKCPYCSRLKLTHC